MTTPPVALAIDIVSLAPVPRQLRFTPEVHMPLPPNPQTHPRRPTLLVEDETVVGGFDAATGAPVIRAKTPDGRADESTVPTDPREAPKK
jgi:hypothetical protein